MQTRVSHPLRRESQAAYQTDLLEFSLFLEKRATAVSVDVCVLFIQPQEKYVN